MQSSRARPPENPERLEDAELARLAHQRHGKAFRLIMQRNNRRRYRVARSILDDDAEAEDVVQQVYVVAFGKLAEFRAETQSCHVAHTHCRQRSAGPAAPPTAQPRVVGSRRGSPNQRYRLSPDAHPHGSRTWCRAQADPPAHRACHRRAARRLAGRVRDARHRGHERRRNGGRARLVAGNRESAAAPRAAAPTSGAGCPAGLGIERHFPLRRRTRSTDDGNGAGQARLTARARRRADTTAGEPQAARAQCAQASFHRRPMRSTASCQRIVAQTGAAHWALHAFGAPEKSDIFMPQSLRTRASGGKLESRPANWPIPCLGRGEGSDGRAKAQGHPQCCARMSNSHRLGGAVAQRGGALPSDGACRGRRGAHAGRHTSSLGPANPCRIGRMRS
jgi:hypothetical protein